MAPVLLLTFFLCCFGGLVAPAPGGSPPPSPSPPSELVFVQVIHRHGQRTPIYGFPTDPNANHDYGVDTSTGNGKLTPLGHKQGREFGEYLRSRYDSFLSAKYSPDQVYVQSTGVSRTVQTVEEVLRGLFPTSPPEKMNNETFRLIQNNVDTTFLPFWSCAKLRALYDETLVSFPLYVKLNKESQDFYKFLEEKSGREVNSFVQVYEIWETLRVENENGLTLPKWATEGENVFKTKMPAYGYLHYVKLTVTDALKRLYSGPLLNELIENMKAAVGLKLSVEAKEFREAVGMRPAKMYIYSGHDTTISPLLDLLGVNDVLNPAGYVAALMIELHKVKASSERGASRDGNSGEDFIIKLFYRRKLNGGDETLPVPNTVSEVDIPKCGRPCSLGKLEATYKWFLLNRPEREEACNEGLPVAEQAN